MDRIQILVAAMDRKDCSLAGQMNIRCDAIIANQAGRRETVRQQTAFGTVTLITTDTKGVGRNRNIALDAADGDLLVFADDDVVYRDDMPQAVTEAFRENPRADVMIFGMDYTRGGVLIEQRHLRHRRLHLFNLLRYGAVSIALRRASLERAGIRFNENFGGGCRFSAGEDSLFLRDCCRSRLRIYSHPYVLGRCARDSSSWFTGCHETYFYDKGVLMGCLFPRTSVLMTLWFGLRFRRPTELSPLGRLKLMYRGLWDSRNMDL